MGLLEVPSSVPDYITVFVNKEKKGKPPKDKVPHFNNDKKTIQHLHKGILSRKIFKDLNLKEFPL